MLEDTVGRNLKKKRHATKLSLENFSGYSNSDAGHVGRIERGQHNATLATLKKIIAPFSMTLHELFNESDLGDDYGVLNCFVKKNFPYIPQTNQSYLVMDELSQTLLESLTIRSVERGALSINNVTFSICELRSKKQPTGYGIMACYEYPQGQVYESVHDISIHKKDLQPVINELRDRRPSPTHFYEVIEDVIQTLYSI